MNGPSLRVVFAGTPEFAATSLEALIQSPHQVIQVLTQPDRPQGRGRKILPSPVKACALTARIPVRQPQQMDTETIAELTALKADLLIVVAYGIILPREALDACRLGAVNVHASLLPRWRGAAPIQRAIECGDEQTGITIMQMDEGLDTGPMLAKSTTPLLAEDTGGSVHDRLAEMGARLLVDTLNKIARSSALPTGEKQRSELATYARKLSKAEAELDWTHSATKLDRMIRAFSPWPVAFTHLGGSRIRILAANPGTGASTPSDEPGTIVSGGANGLTVACGQGLLEIAQLQLSGGKPISATEALNGHPGQFYPGARFGTR